jgi:hypothetical protein
MRASTLLFVGLFGAFALLGHARRHGVCVRLDACPATIDVRTTRDDGGRNGARTRELERDHEKLSQRSRELDRSLQAVDASLRTLHDLARKPGGAALTDELRSIEAGRDRLARMREENEAQKATLLARVQLARAGVDDEVRVAPPAGPVDALGAYELVERAERPARRVTSRAQ